jgi:hypothetical protein
LPLIRFGTLYHQVLARADLDERRTALYTMAMRLSLVAGPLRLLDGDFPDRAGMLEIAEHNLRETSPSSRAGSFLRAVLGRGRRHGLVAHLKEAEVWEDPGGGFDYVAGRSQRFRRRRVGPNWARMTSSIA